MLDLLITNARVVNEGQVQTLDVGIRDGRIERLASHIDQPARETLDANGRHLLPGMMDDQVHFREPGLTHKADMASESAAAVAGGITSFMEMPNVRPPTLDAATLEAKYELARERAWANYAFYHGASNDNLEAIKALDPSTTCGIKIFMGASTGNMLVDAPQTLESIFANASIPVVTHCEDTPMVQAREQAYRERYGEDLPFRLHGEIRSREACLKSSGMAVDLARRHGTRLHVLHLTTAEEMALFEPGPVENKQITAEACVHHLWFSDEDYDHLGSFIKCNPAIKTPADRDAIRAAVNEGRIDIVATDHAPHTLSEKNNSYFAAPSGMPLVQHALLSLLEQVHQGNFTLETVVEKTSHNVARRFEVADRGFIREGCFADLVLVDMTRDTHVERESLLYKCGWSPFEGTTFRARIEATFVNGQRVWDGQQLVGVPAGQRLTYRRS
ncbi:dihydroorotase [Kushneria phosphatilytica]|uniref:Dihydroorotase n=1 Tax=Kushneria phosphatilytica TaxID=657387 RepID=A0A1S1NRN8_9GAMM|nr:dihydroorotase [Kushneria phosphatilytica]OHV11924.1 dihydroorotase [Kushneria phosphatilytica]QEL11106.1 dihydroorotase [Kushneria phosphatilytica]